MEEKELLNLKINDAKSLNVKHVQYCQSDTGREVDSRQTVTDLKYALRSVSIRQRSRWLGKALLNWQDMPTIRTVRTIRTDRERIHDPSQIVRRAVVE